MLDTSTVTDPRTSPPGRGTLDGLEVSDLHTTFGTGRRAVEVVRGVSFSIKRGETLVLLGESGSGKSVTARSILQLYGRAATHAGSVRLDGAELLGLDEGRLRQVRGRRIGLVSQDPGAALDPLRRIGRQIEEVLQVHRPELDKAGRRQRTIDLLGLMGLPHPAAVAGNHPHELSGGMRQRVAIAMAVACDPELLIADEPTTALDVTVQAQILDELDRLRDRFGMAILLVTHDVGVARQMADRVAVMYAGRIVETGDAADVLERPDHPYTAGLLSCLPAPDVPRGALHPLPGLPPMPGEIGPGCPFAPRCPSAFDACREVEPALEPVGGPGFGRARACLLVDREEVPS